MSSTISLSVRSLLVTLGVVVAVLVAYLLGASGSPPAARAAAATNDPDEPARSITTTGSGDATGVPDQLWFDLSVGRTADDVAIAMDQANRRMSQATRAMRAAGVEPRDIKTTGLSIDPRYDYIDQREVLTGYRVEQSVSVVVRSQRSAGRAVSAAVAAGGNSSRVSDLSVRIGDRDALLAQARDRAVDVATQKARQYAAATDQDLGDVLTLSEVKAAPARPVPYAFRTADLAGLSSGLAKLPVRGGSEKVTVQVSVVWGLR